MVAAGTRPRLRGKSQSSIITFCCWVAADDSKLAVRSRTRLSYKVSHPDRLTRFVTVHNSNAELGASWLRSLASLSPHLQPRSSGAEQGSHVAYLALAEHGVAPMCAFPPAASQGADEIVSGHSESKF